MAIVEEQFVSGGRDPGFGSQPSLGGQRCCALTLALAEGPVADQSKEVHAWGGWVHLLPPSEEDGEHGRAAQGRPNAVLPPGFKDQNLQCEAERVLHAQHGASEPWRLGFAGSELLGGVTVPVSCVHLQHLICQVRRRGLSPTAPLDPAQRCFSGL